MKYVIFNDGSLDIPIIFPDFIQHVTVERSHSRWEAVSAGFCRCKGAGFACHGESVSLGLKSRGLEDDVVMHKTLVERL